MDKNICWGEQYCVHLPTDRVSKTFDQRGRNDRYFSFFLKKHETRPLWILRRQIQTMNYRVAMSSWPPPPQDSAPHGLNDSVTMTLGRT